MAKKNLKGPDAVLTTWINALHRTEKFGGSEINVAKEHLSIVEMGVEQGSIIQKCDGTKPYLVIGLNHNNGEDSTMPPKKVKATEETTTEEAPKTKGKAKAAPAEAPVEKATAKKSGAAKPVKAEGGYDAPKKGRRTVYPNDMKFTVVTKLPKKEEEQVEVLGARAGSTRFLIRKEMLDNKCKNFGDLRAHMVEQGLAFNNVDFTYLLDRQHVAV